MKMVYNVMYLVCLQIVDTDDNNRYEVPVSLDIPSGTPEPTTNYNIIYAEQGQGKFSFRIERKNTHGNKVM